MIVSISSPYVCFLVFFGTVICQIIETLRQLLVVLRSSQLLHRSAHCFSNNEELPHMLVKVSCIL